MSTELAEVVESQRALSLVSTMRKPADVLAEAQEAARALRDVIALKPKKVMMNGEQYLEFEDWQTAGRFYSITAMEEGEPEFVDLGGIRGFKSTSIGVDSNGRTISRATAYCLNDEEKWSTRTKYEWAYVKRSGGYSVEDPGKDELVWEPRRDDPTRNAPKKEKVPTGEETVPLFQLASMAQTRANAKALRNVLSWVVVLAGYKTTPAEELDSKASVEENGGSSGGAPPRTNPPQAAQPTPAKAQNANAPGSPTPPRAANGGTPKHGERWTKPCPRCGKVGTVNMSKKADEPGWYCWKKSTVAGGGCGYQFTEADVEIHAGAEQARAAQAGGECAHPAVPPSRVPRGKTVVCPDCGAELRGEPLTATPADDPFGDSLDGPDAHGAEKE